MSTRYTECGCKNKIDEKRNPTKEKRILPKE